MKKIVLTFISISLIIVAYYFYSLQDNFNAWPWTKREQLIVWQGVQIGESKDVVFAKVTNVVKGKTVGEIRYSDEDVDFKKLNVDNLELDLKIKEMYFSLNMCNCLITMRFNGDRLEEIEKKTYRGPSFP